MWLLSIQYKRFKPNTLIAVQGVFTDQRVYGRTYSFAKKTHTPVLLVGHITKDGNIAGPKVMEHMVDTVLQFEGDQNVFIAFLEHKNRFGSTARNWAL